MALKTTVVETLSELPDDVRAAAEMVWDFHHVNHTVQKADCILALGSNDIRVAHRAAQLYLDGYAPIVVMSGGMGRMTEGLYGGVSEAEAFARAAEAMGVPRSAIIVEDTSTNTGENVAFSRERLKERGLSPQSFIVVQKPYMERRALATFRKVIPDEAVTVAVTSPPIAFSDYPQPPTLPLSLVIMAMAGDLQRCKLYGRAPRFFQAPVAVPKHVWAALRVLAAAGFTEQLIVDEAASKEQGRVVYEALDEDEPDEGDASHAAAAAVH